MIQITSKPASMWKYILRVFKFFSTCRNSLNRSCSAPLKGSFGIVWQGPKRHMFVTLVPTDDAVDGFSLWQCTCGPAATCILAQDVNDLCLPWQVSQQSTASGNSLPRMAMTCSSDANSGGHDAPSYCTKRCTVPAPYWTGAP